MSETQTFYVGTYVGEPEEASLFQCRLDPASGQIETVAEAREIPNPSFLAGSSARKTLYAVSEHDPRRAGENGKVHAFRIDPDAGAITSINRADSGGVGPCFVSVEPYGAFVCVTSYAGGTVAILPIRNEGGLDEPSCVRKLTGSGPNPERQEAPHPHSAYVSADGRTLLVPDLGADLVRLFEIDRDALRIEEAEGIRMPPGSGPRHMAFHPSGRHAYVVNELDGTVSLLELRGNGAAGEVFETVPLLGQPAQRETAGAHLELDASGRYLYASARDNSRLLVFAVKQPRNRLSLVQEVGSGGVRPRNFALAPGGRFLLAANHDTDNIALFRVDPDAGTLTEHADETGAGAVADAPSGVRLPAPVCVAFL